MNYKCYFLILLSIVVSSSAQAQKQNNVWAFGLNAGIDFNGSNPASLNTSMTNNLGCAAVSDHSGALLFYTDGDTVWNRNHIPMPNGTGLISGDGTVFQSVAIVPFINDTTRFYIFQLTTKPSVDTNGSLYYSVIDMSLSGGLGDVSATQKNQLLWDRATREGLGSGMATVSGTGCNIWLINHIGGNVDSDNNKFVAHEITQAGINTTAVVSQSGGFSGRFAYMTGMIKSSPDGRKLANTTLTISEVNGVTIDYSALEIQDFNPATGVVSNSVTLDSTAVAGLNILATGFSPVGTKLYSTTPFVSFFFPSTDGVYQFDLSLPTIAAIRASKTLVSTSAFACDVSAAPDGKMYVSLGLGFSPAPTLDRIDAPDAAGIGCGYTPGALTLLPNTGALGTLPNPVVYPVQDSLFNTHDTLICSGDGARFSAPGGFLRYYWQGQPSTDTSFEVTASGTYWLTYENDCTWVTDTFRVLIPSLESRLRYTALCDEQFPLTLDASAANSAGTQYAWQDGTTGPLYTVNSAGIYAVTMQLSDCSSTDSIQITQKPDPVFSLGADTLICRDRPLELKAPAAEAYLWQNGSTGSELLVADSGLYWVSITLNGCTGGDSIRVLANNCDCKAFTPNAFSPNGDGLNDIYVPVISCGSYDVVYQLSIYNRWGQQVFYSRDPGKGWDGRYNGQPADAGTYFFNIAYAAGQDTETYSKKGDILLIR